MTRRAPSMTEAERREMIERGERPAYSCGDPACPECAGIFPVWHRADLAIAGEVNDRRRAAEAERERKARAEEKRAERAERERRRPRRKCIGCGVRITGEETPTPDCDACAARVKKRRQRKAANS